MPELKDELQGAFDRPDAKHSCCHFVWQVNQAFVPDQQYLVDKSDSRSLATPAKGETLIVGRAGKTQVMRSHGVHVRAMSRSLRSTMPKP
jgi:hypothetical protein